MSSEPMAAVLALLGGGDEHDQGGTLGLSPTAAAAAAAALGVDGISAGVGTGPEGVILAWGPEQTAIALENAQFTLGQGPGFDAMAAGAPVLEPDLDRSWATDRWPAFTLAATKLGVRAVFAFPLRIGAISVGVLTAHRNTPGPLGDGELTDALALADAVTIQLLHRVEPGAARAAAGPNGPCPGWARPSTHRAEVHQATGMISVQLEVSLAEALVRLRAYAYAEDRLIDEVAADVVARSVRFTRTDP